MATLSALAWPVGLALAAFCFALFALKIPRAAMTALGAALVFGLAGYAWQGSPGLAGVPARLAELSQQEGEQLVAMRREVMAERYYSRNERVLITADALARRGQFSNASVLYRGIARENPQDSEAWLGLANALIAHADGAITPAAAVAFRRAEAAAPESAGVPFFFGLNMLQAGEVLQGRAAWAEALGRMEEGSENHERMKLRLDRLDELIGQLSQSRADAATQSADSADETEPTPAIPSE